MATNGDFRGKVKIHCHQRSVEGHNPGLAAQGLMCTATEGKYLNREKYFHVTVSMPNMIER